MRSSESDPALAMDAVIKRPAAAAKTPPAKRPALEGFYPAVRLNQTPAADAVEQHHALVNASGLDVSDQTQVR